jgi:hypothetical protein
MPTTRGGTVPLVMSYRRVTKKPVIERHRRFVGWRCLLSNLALKAIELIEEVCYEVQSEVLDAGDQQVVHWALEIDDPWGVHPESALIATRMHERPACGANFEVITVVEAPKVPSNGSARGGPTPPVAPRRPDHEAVQERMRQRIISGGHFDPEAGPPSA